MQNLSTTPQLFDDPESWAEKEKSAEEQAKLDQKAREKERLEYEEAERQRKIEERENAEKLRLEAERFTYYQQLEKLDFALLSLADYPDDSEIFAAKRSRTLWYVILGSALFLFLLSLFKLTYAWVGGIAGGLAFVVWFTHGLKIINFFPSLTNYSRLINKRRKLKRQLLDYIQQIEGNKNFMHRVYPLIEYNQRLGAKKYKRLVTHSMYGNLVANLRTLEDTEIFHDYMQEALKAFKEYLWVKEEERQAAEQATRKIEEEPNLAVQTDLPLEEKAVEESALDETVNSEVDETAVEQDIKQLKIDESTTSQQAIEAAAPQKN